MIQYKTTENKFTVKQTGERDRDQEVLCNFTAEIIKETIIIDGLTERTIFTIKGESEKRKFKTIEVTAEKFGSLSWITSNWGATAVVFPGSGIASDLRTAIQILSTDIETEYIYQHTGWTEIDGKPAYLHGGGAITDEGNNESIRVEMPADLSRYRLPTIAGLDDKDKARCFESSMRLIFLASHDKIAPLLAATWRACIDSADFAVHCTGRSGSFKSEVTSLMQSHYGEGMDARHLPGSWNSTANALEALAYRAKNALFVIDDFIPVGTSWQQKQYQGNADRIMRAQGNQQGRARLNDVSSLQQTMYPRGLVMSSGEDTPEGQSLRGRMMIIELSQGDVKVDRLTECQERRADLPIALANFIQWLARGRDSKLEHFHAKRVWLRDQFRGIGHTRTPQMMGDLIAAVELYMMHGTAMGYIPKDEADSYLEMFTEAITMTANDQNRFIVESDPGETFIKVLQSAFMAKRVHVVAMDGGSPEFPLLVGWTEDRSSTVYNYQSRGTKIGWIDEEKNSLYIDHAIGYEELRKQSSGQISVTSSTLWKRLRESGIINRHDEKRQRSTIRLTCEGSMKTVVCIDLSKIIEFEQVDNDHEPF